MVNMGCLVVQVRASQMIKVISLPDSEAPL